MDMSYVSIVTERLDELKGFYVSSLGLEEYTDWAHEGFRALRGGEGLVLAFHSPAAFAELGLDPESDGGGSSMLTFDPGSAAALQETHDRLAYEAVTVIREPFTTPYGSMQAIYRDLDGNVFRLNTFTS